MFRRVQELWKQGGIAEVSRGIRDYLGLDRVHARLINERTFIVGAYEVKLIIEGTEDLKRSRGHGEVAVLEDFITEVQPDDVVWDIGANVGTYSLFAAKRGADVVAFEPASDALPRLYQNIDLNSVDISVREFALANENGTRTLVDAEKSGHKKLAEGEGETISVKRGDDIPGKRPDVVKIDVEGAEYEVIQGIKETLSEVRACYVEFHEGVARSDLTEILGTAGLNASHKFDGNATRDLELIKFER